MRTHDLFNAIAEGRVDRNRLTQTLQDVVAQALDRLSDLIEPGTEICRVPGAGTLRVSEMRTNVGYWHGVRAGAYVFDARHAAGESWYVHGDFHSSVTNAPRDVWLAVANHMAAILEAANGAQGAVVQSLRDALEQLQIAAQQ